MPFITPDHRDHPDFNVPGDRCYAWYKWLVDEWKKERRWSTADRLYDQVIEFHKQRKLKRDSLRALDLAWQVFFSVHVMPYELEKQRENGDI